MNNIQNINAWFKTFEHRMHNDVPVIVAETAVSFYKSKFKTQEWDGVAWKALNTNYQKRKRRSKNKILTASGILMNSIHPSLISNNRVIISAGNTKAPYARIHNEGLRVIGTQKVRAYSNNNFMGKGKRVAIKAHTRKVNYKMHKRQFMGHSTQLNQQITSRLINYFNK